MKIPFNILRWVLLSLYLLLILSFIVIGVLEPDNCDWKYWLTLILTLISQGVFLSVCGSINLCRPVKHRKLVFPIVIASLMMCILVGGLCLSLSELFKIDDGGWFPYVFWMIVGINWIVWSIIFLIYSQKTERFKVLRTLTITILAGSLVELLIGIPSHIIVSRRPGCFVGIRTGIGIIAGIYVMFWAFGPGIILLFLRNKYRNQKAEMKDKTA